MTPPETTANVLEAAARPIVAWVVAPDPHCDYDQGSSLVLAETRERARYLGARDIEMDYVDVVAKRAPDCDKLVDERGERIVGVRELRQLGWGQADESACESCGLWSFDMPEFEICGECGNCKECGHATDDEPCLASARVRTGEVRA